MALNDKQRRFVDEYLVDCNATQAAIRAGYSAKTAANIGHENLRKPEIAQAIQEGLEAASVRTGVTLDRVLLELARIAFSDVRKVASWGANGAILRESNTIEDDAAAAIAEVSQTTGQFGPAVKVKLWNKNDALKQLREHLTTNADKGEGSIDDALDELDAESPLGSAEAMEE